MAAGQVGKFSVVFMGLVFFTSVAGARDLGSYGIILEKSIFGQPKPQASGADASPVPPAPEVPPFTRDLRMCAISETRLGIRVGIINLKAQPPQNYYYLRLGEEQDGFELVDADYDRGAALIRYSGSEAWIFMDSSQMSRTSGSTPGQSASVSKSATAGKTRTAAYLERQRKWREVRDKRNRELEELSKTKAAADPEELEKHLQNLQMELIRAGGEKGPPLPIPLTKEMDDQLVAEGVLPPME